MKNKVFIFIIGLLVGAIIASAGFLIFGGNKGKRDGKDFDPSKFQDGNFTPPSGFSRDKKDIDFNNIDPNNLPERPTKEQTDKTEKTE
ncbi:MAG: hypothetical protein J5881_05150 [Clostridia bacterium]|nr:hypothetical protein [Clostridia bacterium]